MRVDQASPIGDLATSIPGALRVFDDLRIDYFCRGARSLADACRARGLAIGDVVARIEGSVDRAPLIDPSWVTSPLAALVDHIVTTYHAPTRDELPRLRRLAASAQNEGYSQRALCTIAALLAEFESELVPHMVKEERILFPYIVALEARTRAGNRKPFVPHGAEDSLLRAMLRDHKHAEDVVSSLREAASHYVAPAGAAQPVIALFDALNRLERTLHHHLHLESNILFRRAIAL